MTQSTRWSEERGREVVERWKRSGQSMSAFAREHGVDRQRVRYWRERVREEESERRRSRPGRRRGSGAGELVPGVVVGLGTRAPICVHLPGGMVVEAQSAGDVEPAWIAAVVRALEGSP